jgi:hypothetical protein
MARKDKKKKSIVKRILKWTGITFLLLLIAVIVLPFIFKDNLIQLVKDEANNNLNVKVDFGEFDLSLFSSFPNFEFEIKDVTVVGIEEFEGVRLAGIKQTNITLDLMSVISGNKIEIKKIGIIEPTFNVIVNKEGKANYDIAKVDTNAIEEIEEVSNEETKYAIGLNELYIKKANIIYHDRLGNMYAEVSDLTFDLSGDFTQDNFDVQTKTLIEALTYKMGGVSYMRKAKIDLLADVNIDKFVKYTLKDNSLKVNELDLGFDGFVEMLKESINLDMTFNAKQTEFKSILSLVPAVYLTDFAGVQTKGKLALNGFVKGEMKGEEMPAFDLNLLVDNGYFKYPDLPSSVDNINIKTNITHPQGDLDKMVINVSKFDLNLANNPINATLRLSNPLSDPNIKSKIVAKLDLEKIATVIPMAEGEKYNGLINADLEIAGRLSSIEKEQYQDFKALGNLEVTEMLYTSKDIPYDILVNSLNMEFSPQYVNLKEFSSKVGESDFSGNGRIDNILHYVFNGEELKGSVNLNSQKINLDELITIMPEETDANIEATTETVDTAYGVFVVPANYDMNLNTNIKELIYDGLTIKDIKGAVDVKDEIATLKNVSMNTLGGNVMMNGSYNTQKEKPLVDFDYDIKNVNIEQTVKYFNSIETLAPIAKKCKGNISTKLSMNTLLDENMSPIYSSLSGMGDLQSNSLVVSGVKVLDKLSEVLKIKDLATQKLANLNMSFMFQEGKLIVKPFDTKLSGMKTNVSGYTAFDQTISYDMLMDVPKAKLGGQANQFMSSLLGKANDKGVNVSIPDIIPVKITIGGTVMEPKLQTNLKGQATNLVNDVKEKVIDTIKKTFNAEIDKLMADAQAQAQKIRDEAKTQADKLRGEGLKVSEQAKKAGYEVAEKIKAEGYKTATDIEASAKNPLEKLAKKKLAEQARAETDKKYEQAKAEADKKGEIPLNEANKKADAVEVEGDKRAQQVIDAAQVKADKLKQ